MLNRLTYENMILAKRQFLAARLRLGYYRMLRVMAVRRSYIYSLTVIIMAVRLNLIASSYMFTQLKMTLLKASGPERLRVLQN